MGPDKKEYAYEQVYNTLKSQIIAQDWDYMDKLPGKRELAKQFKVSINTIEHALSLLEEEGYLCMKKRSGTYITYQKDSLFLNPPQTTPSTFIPPIYQEEDFPKTPFCAAFRKVIASQEDLYLVKSDPKGLLDLRTEIKHYLKRSRKIDVEEAQIIIGAGARDLYGKIARLFQTKSFGIEDPSYQEIQETYAGYGVSFTLAPLLQDGIAHEFLTNTHVDVLHVTPYRSYPSQITTSATKRQEYLDYAKLHHAYLIEDDYESEFSQTFFQEETLFMKTELENVIYLNSFSSTIGKGIALSYMILPKSLVSTYDEILGQQSCLASIYNQMVVLELLQSGVFERHLNRIRRKRRLG